MAAGQGRSMALLLLAALGLLSVVDRASAAEYAVGSDSSGWIIPQPKTYYDDWLAGKKFIPGDVLVFQYLKEAHTVLQVSKADYEVCNLSNPIDSFSSGNDQFTLKAAGDYYFICGVSIHCSVGQKVHITVAASSKGPMTKPPSPSPAGSSAIAPAPASASGLHAAGALVCSAFMVLVAALVF